MNNKSFTLIELLVVIVIIGILAGVIMISTSSSIDKANIAKSKAFTENFRNNLIVNLVSEWNFNDIELSTLPNGTVINNVSDDWGSNHGTSYGDILIEGDSKCVVGKCLGLSGDDYIETANLDKVYFDTNFSNGYSFSAWAKPNTALYRQGIMGTGSYGRSSIVFVWNETCGHYGNIASTYDDFNGVVQSVHTANNGCRNFIDGQFHQIIVSAKKGEKLRLYIDGRLYDEKDISTSISLTYPNIVFRLGDVNHSNTSPFRGLIDELKLYNSGLTEAEIKQNYIAGLNSMLANGNMSKTEYNQRIELLASNTK